MVWLLTALPLAAAALIALRRPADRMALARVAGIGLALTLAAATLALAGGWTDALDWGPALQLRAALPPISALAALLVPTVALPIVLYAAAHEAQAGLARLIALLLVFVGAMELLVTAADLLTLLIAWELVGACSWALIGHHWRERGHWAASRYAFVFTRLGDLGLFVAAMATFAATGSFAYASLGELQGASLGVAAAGVLIAAAAKSGQIPFSPWLFRAMAGPTSVSALLHAAAMVAAGAFLLARLQPELAAVPWFGPAAIGIGLATALAGGLVALLQADSKKLLAASTSAHYGLMFVAVGAGYPGVAALHLVAHAGFKALLFLTAGIAGERQGTFALAALRLGRALPWVAAANAVGALALAGVPPLGGAWTKEAIVAASGHVGHALAVAVMLAGGLSAAYATRNQLLIWGRSEAGGGSSPPHRLEYGAIGALAIATGLLSLLWLPAVRHAVGGWLGGELPAATGSELALSLAIVAVGICAGWLLSRRLPNLGRAGLSGFWSEWLGLPAALHVLAGRPLTVVARAAARLDDRIADAIPRSAAMLARKLAAVGSGLGEFIVDGLPGGLARLIGIGGTDARRLQTGMTQHYYAAVVVGAAVLTLVLLLGAAA